MYFSRMQVKGISAASEVLRVNTQRKNTCYTWRGIVTDRCNVSGWETRSLCSVRACLRLDLFNYRMNCRYQLFMHLSVCHSFNSIPKSIAIYVGVKSIIGISKTEHRTMPNVHNSRDIIRLCCSTSVVP